MSSIIPFKKEHLRHLLSQEINKSDIDLFSEEFIDNLEQSGSYITITYKDMVMACGGITPYWPGRGEIWTMFSEESAKYFVATFRLIKWWLHQQINTNYRRIELSIRPDYERPRKRAELLGFKLEIERARKYLPSGEDCSIYSMVRG